MTARMSRWITTGERPALPAFVSSFAKGAPSGGSDDDDADDDDEDDEDDDGEDDDPDADKSDEELRAELKSTRDALAKANGQSAKRRRALREREAELEEARKPKKPKADGDDSVDVDEIRAAAKREGEQAGLVRAKKAEARAALLGAGVTRERVARAVGLLDLDELDLDDDGLDGVDEAIADLKKSWPELFVKPRTRRSSVIGEGDRNGDNVSRKPKTASEKAAAQLLGR